MKLDDNHALSEDDVKIDSSEPPQPPQVLGDLEKRIQEGYGNDPWLKIEANVSRLTEKDCFGSQKIYASRTSKA